MLERDIDPLGFNIQKRSLEVLSACSFCFSSNVRTDAASREDLDLSDRGTADQPAVLLLTSFLSDRTFWAGRPS